MSRELTPEDYELLLLLDDGLKKTRTLSAAAAQALPQAAADSGWMGEECRICLCQLDLDDDVRALPRCNHHFHAACAERWLTTSKASCPLCGLEVFE